MEAGLISILAAGGDMATIGLLVVMWRFDRRLLSMEIQFTEHSKTHKDRG